MKKKLSFLFSFFLVLLIATGCIESPQFKGVSNFKLEEINREKVTFNMDVETFNPNNKKIKIRKSTFKLYLNERFIGDAKLLDNYKMGKNITTLENVPVEVLLEKDVFVSLLQIAAGQTVKVRIEGKLKASVSGFPQSRDINQTTEINLKELGLNLGGLLGF